MGSYLGVCVPLGCMKRIYTRAIWDWVSGSSFIVFSFSFTFVNIYGKHVFLSCSVLAIHELSKFKLLMHVFGSHSSKYWDWWWRLFRRLSSGGQLGKALGVCHQKVGNSCKGVAVSEVSWCIASGLPNICIDLRFRMFPGTSHHIPC